jgi:Zn-dependent peptidase ImmA (M78 family)/transcriptional regulator with XRE-family HTH domain
MVLHLNEKQIQELPSSKKMEQKINPDMLIIAREFRELSQMELSSKTGFSQSKITRLESGLFNDLNNDEIQILASSLDIPIDFLFQKEERIGYGSSAYFYRKKAKLTGADSKRIHAMVNILRMNLKRLLQNVDIKPKRPLPQLGLENYEGSPRRVAQAIRSYWRLPDGPVNNLTGVMESAGIIIISCQFGTRAMDATSLWLSELPPMIFINCDVPGDRWRFTLAHELAHLVMHDGAPYEAMEDEADEFAAEFLVPEAELKAQLSLKGKLKLADFANLKPYWKASMGMLIRNALDLGFISDTQRRYFYTSMKAHGGRAIDEPNPLPREEPTNHKNLMKFYQDEMNYSQSELLKFLKSS